MSAKVALGKEDMTVTTKKTGGLAVAMAGAAVLTSIVTAGPAKAGGFDCRVDGDDRCIVRIANANEGGAIAYWYQFRNGKPTDWVMLHPKQFIEDDRYIVEVHAPTSEGAWDCRWDGDDKCVGKLGGVRYVFPFSDGSPEAPYVSAWQG